MSNAKMDSLAVQDERFKKVDELLILLLDGLGDSPLFKSEVEELNSVRISISAIDRRLRATAKY